MTKRKRDGCFVGETEEVISLQRIKLDEPKLAAVERRVSD